MTQRLGGTQELGEGARGDGGSEADDP
jgi:hypothetical protein